VTIIRYSFDIAGVVVHCIYILLPFIAVRRLIEIEVESSNLSFYCLETDEIITSVCY
jgi:hypothetical protein